MNKYQRSIKTYLSKATIALLFLLLIYNLPLIFYFIGKPSIYKQTKPMKDNNLEVLVYDGPQIFPYRVLCVKTSFLLGKVIYGQNSVKLLPILLAMAQLDSLQPNSFDKSSLEQTVKSIITVNKNTLKEKDLALISLKTLDYIETSYGFTQQYSKAIETANYIRSLKEKHNFEVLAYETLGRLYYLVGNLDKSEYFLTKNLQQQLELNNKAIRPLLGGAIDISNAIFNLSLTQERLGKYHLAEKNLLQVLNKYNVPTSSIERALKIEALYRLGLLYIDMRNFKQAEISIEKALSLMPVKDEAVTLKRNFILGYLNQQAGDLTKAKTHYHNALLLAKRLVTTGIFSSHYSSAFYGTNSQFIYSQLGLIEYSQKNYKLAIEYYNKALKADRPYQGVSLCVTKRLGDTYLALKNTKQSNKHYQEAINQRKNSTGLKDKDKNFYLNNIELSCKDFVRNTY